jgi:hypothetical protein
MTLAQMEAAETTGKRLSAFLRTYVANITG